MLHNMRNTMSMRIQQLHASEAAEHSRAVLVDQAILSAQSLAASAMETANVLEGHVLASQVRWDVCMVTSLDAM